MMSILSLSAMIEGIIVGLVHMPFWFSALCLIFMIYYFYALCYRPIYRPKRLTEDKVIYKKISFFVGAFWVIGLIKAPKYYHEDSLIKAGGISISTKEYSLASKHIDILEDIEKDRYSH